MRLLLFSSTQPSVAQSSSTMKSSQTVFLTLASKILTDLKKHTTTDTNTIKSLNIAQPILESLLLLQALAEVHKSTDHTILDKYALRKTKADVVVETCVAQPSILIGPAANPIAIEPAPRKLSRRAPSKIHPGDSQFHGRAGEKSGRCREKCEGLGCWWAG